MVSVLVSWRCASRRRYRGSPQPAGQPRRSTAARRVGPGHRSRRGQCRPAGRLRSATARPRSPTGPRSGRRSARGTSPRAALVARRPPRTTATAQLWCRRQASRGSAWPAGRARRRRRWGRTGRGRPGCGGSRRRRRAWGAGLLSPEPSRDGRRSPGHAQPGLWPDRPRLPRRRGPAHECPGPASGPVPRHHPRSSALGPPHHRRGQDRRVLSARRCGASGSGRWRRRTWSPPDRPRPAA
jgi:hypothetical protein